MSLLDAYWPTTRTVPVDTLAPGMTIVGGDGGSTVVHRVGGYTYLTGLVTVWTEYGPLLLDPDEYVQVLP